MDWWLASFFIGAILSLFLPIVPEFFELFLLLCLSICFFYYSNKFTKPLRASSGLLFGATWMLFNAINFQQLWQGNNLDAVKLSAKAHWVKGQVLSLYSSQQLNEKALANISANKKRTTTERLRFNFSVTHIDHQKLNQPMQLRLSWKNNTVALQQGQFVQLKVKFKPAHGLANLGSFSYQTWLNSNAISATGYVVKHKNNHIIQFETSIRQKLFSTYKMLLPKHELAPLLLALGFGSRSDLSPDLWQVLQATGTGHLIAISGLHIGLVATASFYLFTLFIRVLPLSLFSKSCRLQSINARYFAIGLSVVMALSYGYLAGFSLPTVRALVMLAIFWLIRLLAIKLTVKRWLLLTLVTLTLIAPFSLFTASFWLSVYAVTVIFLTLWRFKNTITSGSQWWRFIKGLLVIQLSLTLLLLPVSAIFFQQISLLALAANLIAVPWMSFISIPLCLLSIIVMPLSETLSQFLIMLCLSSIQWLWQYLNYLASLSSLVIELSSLSVKVIVFAGLLSVAYLFFQPRISFHYKRLFAFLCVIILVTSLVINKNSNSELNNWQLVVFDVGQGLSILIKRQNRAVLYDTGAAYESGFNMVEAVIEPYLQHANILSLDKVFISHGDNDHAGGLAVLQQSTVINELIYNNNKDDNTMPCLQGDQIKWQGLKLEVLWPKTAVAKKNDESCVLLISDDQHQVLLTGDISKKVESDLVTQYPSLKADVLVVPHHGSKTSSSERLIRQLEPKIAVVSAGYLNRWKMPVNDVVKRYQSHNVKLLNTATSGQIIINFSNKGITKQTYRDDLWPFWFAN